MSNDNDFSIYNDVREVLLDGTEFVAMCSGNERGERLDIISRAYHRAAKLALAKGLTDDTCRQIKKPTIREMAVAEGRRILRITDSEVDEYLPEMRPEPLPQGLIRPAGTEASPGLIREPEVEDNP